MKIELNKPDECLRIIQLNLTPIEFMIFHEAISKYAIERENELDRKVANRMLKNIKDFGLDISED